MPLTQCPECGHQVSTQAAACPGCGAPIAAPAPPQATPKVGRAGAKWEAIGTVTLITGVLIGAIGGEPAMGLASVVGFGGLVVFVVGRLK